ncbi:MAG: septum site-determining protein MinC, partial [Deltaproteobacteria bacterium]|nr:septum site-determining protein MinC [Deltaproteobacteria bacterium]
MTPSARSQPRDRGGSSVRDEPLEMRGTSFPLTVVRLRTADVTRLRGELRERSARAGEYFVNSPTVVDLQLVESELAPGDVPTLFDLLREVRFVPVGVCNGTPQQQQASLAAGLAVLLSPARGRSTAAPKEPAAAAESPRPPEASPPPPAPPSPAVQEAAPAQAQPDSQPKAARKSSKVLAQPVRSGQRIYARGADLVVVGAVNPGAEVIADGNVHIYGALRGRALAGAGGDTEARIFCQSLEAELVSIAGTYRVIEDLPKDVRGKPAQVYFAGDTLVI